MIETAPDEAPHHVADGIARLSAENLAALRRVGFFTGRWLAKLAVWGEFLAPADRNSFGISDQPTLFIETPEIGPELAESCRGIPVNLARRPDGLICHWYPDGPDKAQGDPLDSRVLVGFVQHAWVTSDGVMGILLLNGVAHTYLVELERTGDLFYAGICLSQQVQATLTRTAGGLIAATVSHARASVVNFSAHPLRPGARVVRRLTEDEVLDERENVATEHLLVPSSGARGVAIDPSTLEPVTIAGGSVGGPEIGNNAVGTAKRQNVNVFTASVSHTAAVGFQVSTYLVTHNLSDIVNVTVGLDSITGEANTDRFTGVFVQAGAANSFTIRVVSTNPNVTLGATVFALYW